MRLDSRPWLHHTLNSSLQWITAIGNLDYYAFLQHSPTAKLFIELENAFMHTTGLAILQIASNSVEAGNSLFEQVQSDLGLLDHCCRL